MPKRTNRRDLIIQTAAQLFERNGYQATATRQIAKAVGCTEAALYYHFREGKHALLRAVMAARMPEVQSVMDQCRQATSLNEALQFFGNRFEERTSGMRWLMMELPHLGDEERAAVLEAFSAMRNALVTVVQRFVPDETQADRVAWLVFCIGVGYQQLFAETAFQGQIDLSMQKLMETFTHLMA
jgi:AcrR family transcriptional regulator